VQDDAFRARVEELHAEGISTNHIASVLGVPRGRVAPLVREIGRRGKTSVAELPLFGCWVSAGWSDGLTVEAGRGWPDRDPPDPSVSGLVGVLVARGPGRSGGDVSVAGYLVDTYCLGVKDALPPRRMRERKVSDFLDRFFDGFEAPPVPAPIDLARQLVWGAVEYARGLGFEPHPDLRPAAGHLGHLDEPCAIGFGQDGKPFYVQGPYDDADRILRTLDRTAGRDNYHFLAGAEAFDLV
jgi:hypothetical protein